MLFSAKTKTNCLHGVFSINQKTLEAVFQIVILNPTPLNARPYNWPVGIVCVNCLRACIKL